MTTIDSTIAARGAWVRSGLLRAGHDLVGHYRLSGGRQVQGRLAFEGATVAVFVKDPPRQGLYEHERCLQLVGGGWLRLHFERPPHSAESAVAFTEHFLTRCVEGQRDE